MKIKHVDSTNIPLENHILCDPPAKPAKTVRVESTSAQESESVNLLYTLVGDDKVYSNKYFPIKNLLINTLSTKNHVGVYPLTKNPWSTWRTYFVKVFVVWCCDVVRGTINEDQTRWFYEYPCSSSPTPRFNPKGTEFEVKNQFSQNSSLTFSLSLATYK